MDLIFDMVLFCKELEVYCINVVLNFLIRKYLYFDKFNKGDK